MTARRTRMSGTDRTRQLLDAAEELFAERGFAQTSIEDIARAAGVTRPVVYERLGAKEEAFLAVVERVRAELEERMIAGALAHTDPRAQLGGGIDAYYAYLEEQPRRWIILYGSSTPVVGDLGRALTDARFATVDKIAVLLRAHLADDVDDEWLSVLSHVVSGAVEQVGRWWLRHPEASRSVVVERFVDVAWGGLGQYVVGSGGRADE